MKRIAIFSTFIVFAAVFISACSPALTPYQAANGTFKKNRCAYSIR